MCFFNQTITLFCFTPKIDIVYATFSIQNASMDPYSFFDHENIKKSIFDDCPYVTIKSIVCGLYIVVLVIMIRILICYKQPQLLHKGTQTVDTLELRNRTIYRK